MSIICNCAICDLPITNSDMEFKLVSDQHIYKCGELQYIELFHTKCEEQETSQLSDEIDEATSRWVS